MSLSYPNRKDWLRVRAPLAIDLFCGLGGWTEGLLAEGFDVIGFDIERHQYDDAKYPAQLVLQDVLTLHGKQFKDAALIVASPPCQAYSYRAMPWKRAELLVVCEDCHDSEHNQEAAASDIALESQIERTRQALITADEKSKKLIWVALCSLIKQRSPQHVKQLEHERGLR